MVVVNMSGVGQLVEEGNYPVTLTKVSEKKTAKGDDMVTFQATIKDSGTDMDGKSLFRNFVIPTSTKAGEDWSGILYYLQKCLLAFGADEEDVTSGAMDPVKVGQGLYGNRANATVTHVPDRDKPEVIRAAVEFEPSDF